MSAAFLQGFSSEMEKLGGVLGMVGKTLVRHPIATLTGAGIAASAGKASLDGYRSGLRGGEKGRQLLAGKEGPSQAFGINYHQLFEHKKTPKQVRALSQNYRESAYKR